MKNDPSRPAAPLDARAAFIVHVTGSEIADTPSLAGRVEHVTSGRSMRFTSIPELVDFMSRITARLDKEDGPDEPRDHAQNRCV